MYFPFEITLLHKIVCNSKNLQTILYKVDGIQRIIGENKPNPDIYFYVRVEKGSMLTSIKKKELNSKPLFK